MKDFYIDIFGDVTSAELGTVWFSLINDHIQARNYDETSGQWSRSCVYLEVFAPVTHASIIAAWFAFESTEELLDCSQDMSEPQWHTLGVAA